VFATVGMHAIHPPIIDSHYFHAIPLTARVPFWSCDSDSFFSHMPTCPRSAATLADQFSRNSAHETRKIRSSILRASILGATGPYNGINPLWRRCAGVKSHGTCVSCFVRRASAFAAVQVPLLLLLLLRVPVGCRRREAGSSCGRRSSSQKTHSQHQP
jgi:hypothetical protein